jgi:hypothetical protein
MIFSNSKKLDMQKTLHHQAVRTMTTRVTREAFLAIARFFPLARFDQSNNHAGVWKA